MRTYAAAALQHLDRPQADGLVAVDRAEGQGGDTPRLIDRRLHEFWRARFAHDGFGVAGEEEDDVSLVELATRSPTGQVVALDALDGTSNFAALGVGWAISAVAYQELNGDLLLLGSSVVQSDGVHFWGNGLFTKQGLIGRPLASDVELLSAPEVGEVPKTWAVAGVGAKAGRTRQFLNMLTDTAGMRTYSLGGTPMISAILQRDLAALVELQETTVFDSAHLLLANPVDVVIGTIDGYVLQPRDVLALFQRVRMAQEHCIPPYIVAKNASVYRYIVDIYDRMAGS